jgi:glycosyltransferase 2 family protein
MRQELQNGEREARRGGVSYSVSSTSSTSCISSPSTVCSSPITPFLIDTLAIRIASKSLHCIAALHSNRHSAVSLMTPHMYALFGDSSAKPHLIRSLPNPALTPFRACCYGFNRMLRQSRKLLLLLLGVLALGYFLYKFRNSITLQGFRWSMVVESLHHARLSLLLLSFVAIYVCYAIRALRWMRFSRALGKTRFWNVYSATLMGFAATFLLGRAGEPVRPVLIARKDSISVPSMFGVYVLERVADMAASVILASYALLSFERSGLLGGEDTPFMKGARSAGALLLVGVIVLIAFLVYFRYHGGEWLGRKLQHPAWRKGWREKIAALLEGFSDGLRGIRTWGDLGALVGYSAAHWLLVVLIYMWIARAFGGDLATLSFTGAMLVLAFTAVGSAVQLPGVGGGAQVATFLVLTLIFGIENESAATTAIVIWLITFAGSCVVGLPLLFREGWSMGELRRMASAEERGGEAALVDEAERASDAMPKETRR